MGHVMLPLLILLSAGITYAHSAKRINVGFYHIYTDGPYYRKIVNDQIRHLNDSGVLKSLQSVQYITVGPDSGHFTIDHEKFIKIKSFQNGYEDLTLDVLQRYCIANSNSNVLYFHPKGSFHHSRENENIRTLLHHFAINTECIKTLDRYDTCGARFSIFPTPHYIGNMWWARCSYVDTLVSPLAMGKNATLAALTQSIFHESVFEGKGWFAGLDRYFSEHWLSTGIIMNPADCLFYDKKWLYGYNAPTEWSVTNEVHCDKALILKDSNLCRQAYQSLPNLYKKAKPILYIARSRVLYGKEPTSLIEWYRSCNLSHVVSTLGPDYSNKRLPVLSNHHHQSHVRDRRRDYERTEMLKIRGKRANSNHKSNKAKRIEW